MGDFSKPIQFERTRTQGIKILQRFASLPFPVIGVANGPATVHSEYLLLTDIHIASEKATYGDLPHPTFGIAAGDDLQVVWEEVVGMSRLKWLLWTGENIDAATARDWGVVVEVVSHERVQARALEIATKLVAKALVYLNLQKQTLNQRLVRRIIEGVPYGMALEGQLPPTSPTRADFISRLKTSVADHYPSIACPREVREEPFGSIVGVEDALHQVDQLLQLLLRECGHGPGWTVQDGFGGGDRVEPARRE